MKKIHIMTILCGFILVFSMISLPISLLSSAEETNNVTISKDDLSLLLPDSYEEYLSLHSASSIAFNDDYIAIADDNYIYLYTIAEKKYTVFQHDQSIKQIEFSQNGVLYFLASDLHLFTLNLDTLLATDTSIACNTFILTEEDVIYYATVTKGATKPLTINKFTKTETGNKVEKIIDEDSSTIPVMNYANNQLYYSLSNVICSNNTTDKKTMSEELTSLIVKDTIFYYTDKTGNFCIYNTANENIKTYSGSYSSVTFYNDSIYLLNGNSVCQYSILENAFTDFSIADVSSNKNRLNDASDTILVKDYIITADTGNNRLSIYNHKTKEYSVIECPFSPLFTAFNGTDFLVADNNNAYIYSKQGISKAKYTSENFTGNILGTTACGNNFYLITQNYKYLFSLNESGEYDKKKEYTEIVQSLIASDVYQNVYIYSKNNGKVVKFTNADFMNTLQGEEKYTFSQQISVLRLDYDLNIYGLSNNTIYCSNDKTYTIDSTDCVYKGNTDLQSFAISLEENKVYLQYKDYRLTTTAFNLPNLSAIDTETSYSQIFGNEDVNNFMVSIQKDAVLIKFDLNNFNDNTFFSYQSYSYSKQEQSCLLLGNTEKYYIIALYNFNKHSYSSNLVLKTNCEIQQDKVIIATDEFEGGKGYTTNAVSVYKYPYLTNTLTLCDLIKNQEITVLGKTNLGSAVDYSYYYISYTQDGIVKKGFIPTSFIQNYNLENDKLNDITYTVYNPKEKTTFTAENGETIQVEKSTPVIAYGSMKEDTVKISVEKDGVLYFANVSSSCLGEKNGDGIRIFTISALLLFAAILLIDFLILKRRKNNYH